MREKGSTEKGEHGWLISCRQQFHRRSFGTRRSFRLVSQPLEHEAALRTGQEGKEKRRKEISTWPRENGCSNTEGRSVAQIRRAPYNQVG